MPKPTNEELINDLRRVMRELGHQPTSTEYRSHGQYSHSLPKARFGSWQAFIEAAQLKYQDRRRSPERRDSELIADVQRVASELGHPPSATEYRELGRHSAKTVYRLAPGDWVAVLTRCLGISEEEARKYSSPGYGYKPRAEILEELSVLANRLGYTPNIEEAAREGLYVKALTDHYGNWASVVAAANLKPVRRKNKAWGMTNEDLLWDLKRVARLLAVPGGEIHEELRCRQPSPYSTVRARGE